MASALGASLIRFSGRILNSDHPRGYPFPRDPIYSLQGRVGSIEVYDYIFLDFAAFLAKDLEFGAKMSFLYVNEGQVIRKLPQRVARGHKQAECTVSVRASCALRP